MSGPNAVGTPVTLRIKWTGNFGGHTVRVAGANPTTATYVVDAQGVALFTYTGISAGTDTVTAVGNVVIPSNAVPVTWISPPARLTGSPVQGRFFTADGSGVFNTPVTQQPLFTQSFSGVNFNPAAGTVAGSPAVGGVTEMTRPFTNVVTDSAGNYAGMIAAQGNGLAAGTGNLYNFSAVFTGTLSVPAAGPVTFTFTSGDGFVFGVGGAGGGAVRVSGPAVNTPGFTAFQGYAVMGGVNAQELRTTTIFPVESIR